MNYIIPFVSLIGVIVGFLLGLLKDFIQNKPKITLDFKTGKFNYYKVHSNDFGDYYSVSSLPENADYMNLELKIDIYNTGKGNTAIKQVDIIVKINKEFNRYFQPKLLINNNENTDHSFNVPANSILTLNLHLRIDKDENYEEYFRELAIGELNDKNRLLFIISANDINDKCTQLVVDPLSVLTA
jgi:hypothetical protein